jgi:hypothetical protein
VSIVVDDSVPAGINITATVHKMPMSWVLSNLVAQADLTFAVEHTEHTPPVVAMQSGDGDIPTFYVWRGGKEAGPQEFSVVDRRPGIVVHIVPKPEIRLTKPGEAATLGPR